MKKLRTMRRWLALTLATIITLTGCGSVGKEPIKYDFERYTREDALEELEAKVKTLSPKKKLSEMYLGDFDTGKTELSSIETYPLTVEGEGQIDIEIAAATEMSSTKAPDDLMNVWAKNFNKSGVTLNGKTVSVSVRQITSGEALTYLTADAYKPDIYAPSSYPWGEMADAAGIGIIQMTDRLVGNTAGILMEPQTYEDFTKQHGEVNIQNVIAATLAGDLTFVTSNPHSSSAGLNALSESLEAFDPQNPLSATATAKLVEYQRKAPDPVKTTDRMAQKAADGIIKAMVMEEQAYLQRPALKDFIYVPFGVRHDHPIYTFDWVSSEKQEAAELFVNYCLSDEAQQIATSKGFNRHNEYRDTSKTMTGAEYLATQKIWKESKTGGKPIIAVFVADISGSMAGTPLNALQKSLMAAMQCISPEAYIGLVTFDDNVYINLEIGQFDATQQAYFAGAVKDLAPGNLTSTYDAVLVALDMLMKKSEEVPDAQLMMFVLSDGDQRTGYGINQVSGIISGLDVQVHTIGYNLDGVSERAVEELEFLANIKENDMIDASDETVITKIYNLFNSEL